MLMISENPIGNDRNVAMGFVCSVVANDDTRIPIERKVVIETRLDAT